jgi:hypothetical protein
MRKSLFLRIVEEARQTDRRLDQTFDAIGKPGLSALQKCVSAIRMLAYGVSADSLDEYIRASESTVIKYMHIFCSAVIDAFGAEYLRHPTKDDIENQLIRSERRGFPGMLGSLYCMHWSWDMCPEAFKGQLQGKEGNPTVILEAACDRRLWIYHFYFGVAGTNNGTFQHLLEIHDWHRMYSPGCM